MSIKFTDLREVALKIRHYKCFGEVEQGFEGIYPINLILGRNNSGKSALIDVIQAVATKHFIFPSASWNGDVEPAVIGEAPFSLDELIRVFRPNVGGGGIPGDHLEFGKRLVGVKFKWKLAPKGHTYGYGIDQNAGVYPTFDALGIKDQLVRDLAAVKLNPLASRHFRRISAERDIEPEIPNNDHPDVSANGRGVTNIVRAFLTDFARQASLVEDDLLADLNQIFSGDTRFERIHCKTIQGGAWEIFLEEKSKGLVPLSQSGSGLKTVIQILSFVHLLPSVEEAQLGDFIFAIEEPENNLHPALLRRLMHYLVELSISSGCVFFITTHSSAAIDFLSSQEIVRIFHVRHNGLLSECRPVADYSETMGILDDLGIRASDLLQANCVVWVEGPSDRVYLNRWISLFTDGELVEGIHYQCVFYGGRVLSHLSAQSPDLGEGSLAALRVNRNAAILIDSDKEGPRKQINATKKRIISEVEASGGVAWVTKGREIENYISAKCVARTFEVESTPQVEPYQDFCHYLEKLQAGFGKRYDSRKAAWAPRFADNMIGDDVRSVLDLDEQLSKLCRQIRLWNGLILDDTSSS